MVVVEFLPNYTGYHVVYAFAQYFYDVNDNIGQVSTIYIHKMYVQTNEHQMWG